MKNYVMSNVLFFCLLCCSVPASQAAELEAFSFNTAWQEIARIDQTHLQTVSLVQVDTLIQQVNAYVDHGKQCAAAAQQELEHTDAALNALGEKVTGEPRDISKERSALQVLKSQVEVRRAQCRLLHLKASDLAQKLDRTKKQIFARDLFSRGPGIFSVLQTLDNSVTVWFSPIQKYISSRSGLDTLLPFHFIVVAFWAGVGFFLARKVYGLWEKSVRAAGDSALANVLVITTQQRVLLYSMGGLAGAVLSVQSIMTDVVPSSYLPDILFSLLFACVICFLVKTYLLFCNMVIVEDGRVPLQTLKGKASVYLFSLTSGALFFMLTSPLKPSVPDATYFLIRATSMVFWYGSLLWIFRLEVRRQSSHVLLRIVRILLLSLLGAVLLAEFFGYRVLATHFLVGTIGTVVLVIMMMLCRELANEVVGGFARGQYGWQRHLRQKVGVEEADFLKGFVWVTKLLKLSLAVLCVYFLLRLWGISTVYSAAFYRWLTEGFSLGTVHIVPTRIGFGFLVFALGWSFFSLVKDKVLRSWLSESELAPSVQDALSTVFGYVGYSLVILFGLTTAGISFSGLAIVAGALSVGIGFGLQNIVNNLVSGLILLIERPIKRGDWVAVGTTEGYVKKISVRSTIIQTFDRSDVIVPNSELISSQVTNMMLQDRRGRVRVAVGVSYGSDTELVKSILLNTAKQHPEVITNGTSPYPVVRFQAFGESSLDFELFCHLKDVDKRIDVRSDLHFAIDAAFREYGVEIPFPQRDLHIKSGFHQEEMEGRQEGAQL